MKPAAFEYVAVRSVDEALDELAQYGDEAKVLAGGQSLIPTMNFRLAEPSRLIDLNGIEALGAFGDLDADGLHLGAMTRQRAVERSARVAQHAPLVHATMPLVAHPQIRNRGTVGGSIAHADPAAELPAVMVVADAQFDVCNRSRRRRIPAPDFFTGLFATALEPDELLTDIVVPPWPATAGWAVDEFARRHGDYALVGAAAIVTLENGRCATVRLGLWSVGDGPVLAVHAANALAGEVPSPEAIRAAAATAADQDVDPPGDIHATSAYRRHLVAVMSRRVLTSAVERARTAAVSG